MLTFQRGASYKRSDVKKRAGLSGGAIGGNWDTGIVEHRKEFLIFANVGTEGRTGHKYGNRWERKQLRWYHKTQSRLGWPSVQRLLELGRRIHVFWRASNDAPFEYAGTAAPAETADTSPVEILWSFNVEGTESTLLVKSPEEILGREYLEGAVRHVLTNTYERDLLARQACIDHYGVRCVVCGLDFGERYGAIGAGFIHVHHLIPLSDVEPNYRLDPIKDLRPVCPNCHAVLHRRRPPISPEALRASLRP